MHSFPSSTKLYTGWGSEILPMVGIRTATPHDGTAWDAFVLTCPEAGPYHLFSWKRAIERAYRHKTYYLIAHGRDGSILGILPLVLVKPLFLRGSLVSLPFCDYGGLVSTSLDISRDLVGYAVKLAENLKTCLELRCHGYDSVLSGCGLGMTSHKVRMVLDLPANSETLWNGYKSKLRSQIKRPQKDGLIFKLGRGELVDDFYTVFRINMHELGSPVHAKCWIEAVVAEFEADAHVGIVYAGTKPVAGGIILTCRDTVTIPWTSALSEFNTSSPNMLLYWGFLQYASDHGFRRFDFGRSTPGEGTYRFKEQWGAHPVSLVWYGEGFSDEVIPRLSGGPLREKVAYAWAKLPQGFVDIAGPQVRRYITL